MSNGHDRTRWGGAILAGGAFLYTVAIILYVFVYGQPKGTGPNGQLTLKDSAEHLLAQWDLVKGIWLTEMTGAVLLALASFVLTWRGDQGRSQILTDVAWPAVGIGATLLTAMYSFILGSYLPALAAFSQDPALFGSLRGGATALFYVASALLFLGLAGAFLGETAAAMFPKSLGIGGAGVALLAALQAICHARRHPGTQYRSALRTYCIPSVQLPRPVACDSR